MIFNVYKYKNIFVYTFTIFTFKGESKMGRLSTMETVEGNIRWSIFSESIHMIDDF